MMYKILTMVSSSLLLITIFIIGLLLYNASNKDPEDCVPGDCVSNTLDVGETMDINPIFTWNQFNNYFYNCKDDPLSCELKEWNFYISEYKFLLFLGNHREIEKIEFFNDFNDMNSGSKLFEVTLNGKKSAVLQNLSTGSSGVETTISGCKIYTRSDADGFPGMSNFSLSFFKNKPIINNGTNIHSVIRPDPNPDDIKFYNYNFGDGHKSINPKPSGRQRVWFQTGRGSSNCETSGSYYNGSFYNFQEQLQTNNTVEVCANAVPVYQNATSNTSNTSNTFYNTTG